MYFEKKMSSIIVNDQLIAFTLFILFWILELYFYNQAKTGKPRELRKIEGVQKIDEAIGRSVEMGKPVLTATGLSSFFSSNTPAVIANLDVINYLANKTAEIGVKLIVGVGPSDVLPVVTELYRQGCEAANKPEMFDADNIRYITPQQWAYTAGLFGIMERERPGANIFIGRYAAEALHMGVIGRRIGAMSIGGNTDLGMASFFAVTCDYVLLGEEVYAAGAYLSKDPYQINAIVAQDVIKLIMTAFMLIGALAATFGSNLITTIIGM